MKNGHQNNFFKLRDTLVTETTGKQNKEYTEIEDLNKQIIDNKKQKKILKTKQEKEQIDKQIQTLENTLKEKKEKLLEIKKTLLKSKNQNITEWELETPKDTRAGAVKDVCSAYKSGFSNLIAGNIKYFNLKYKKKSNSRQCMVISKQYIKNKDGILFIAKQFFKDQCKFAMGKRTKKKYKDLNIECDCRIVKDKNVYWLFIPVINPEKPIIKEPKETTETTINYCGVDPGIRTLFTIFGNKGCSEYNYNNNLIKTLDSRIKNLKNSREKQKRVRKRKINKIEINKSNAINEIHWKSVTGLLKDYDIIFFGDIKSHEITKGGKNRNLNSDMNNIKFYILKQRLLFKSLEKNKHVFFTKEPYTTKTCSFCGKLNNPYMSKIYNCVDCKKRVGRDVNAGKNILMKGIMELSSAFIDDIN
jgi:transposase